MAENIKVMVSCDVMFCSPSGTHKGFKGTYCFLQKYQVSLMSVPIHQASCCCNPEDCQMNICYILLDGKDV